MRPKKTRWVKCGPGERCFQPRCGPNRKVERVCMTLDEFEVVRLSDFEKRQQADAALKMRISRPTYSRILASARSKIADALVNLKAIKIEGGCCRVVGRRKEKTR